jgi:UDPglucose 6-dehydrogenase
MRVTIIGTGYVGLVTGACLAELGNHVFCLDVDPCKVDMLNLGEMPFYEPGLAEMVTRNKSAGRLHFTTDAKSSVEHGDIQFIAVGTPANDDGSADLQYVLSAARDIGRHMNGFKVVVNKSTVPVGTAANVHAAIAQELVTRRSAVSYSVVSNPEFLKEGAAVEDFIRPDRIVIGCDDTPEGAQAREMMHHLYTPFNRHHERTLWMDVQSAEFTKYAANAMLATRISFMNELANLADEVGVDIEAVRLGMGSDPRIGYGFLYAGCGYGGSCFPKDVRALERLARDSAQELLILRAVDAVNRKQKRILSQKIVSRFGGDLTGRHFAVWGLAFKPNTDDMREAPSRVLLADLLKRGATAAVHDPVAMREARRVLESDLAELPQALAQLEFVNSPNDALAQADALVIVTEWKEFRSPDFGQIRHYLKQPVIFDGRNLFEPEIMAEMGIEYHGIGRSTATMA